MYKHDDFSDDEKKAKEAVDKTFFGGASNDIAKGDKIKVIKGDLNGLDGTVITIEDG